MQYPNFHQFYKDIHGYTPYAWQQDVAQYVDLHGEIPEQISVPTGLGKTSMIDIVLWALGKQIYEKKQRTLGQRIVVAVERQVIVDGISQHVETLVDTLNDPRHDSTRIVSDALRTLSYDDTAVKMESFHGSRKSSGEWVNATGVTIVSTTVTQVTLRLLGRAPGVSRGVAPIHAGLLAKDALILIDEPHLVSPQVTTVKQLLSLEEGLSQVCLMGATIQQGLVDTSRIYTFDKHKETQHAINKISYKKDLMVETTGKRSIKDRAVDIVKTYMKQASDLRLGIIVNTIDEAQAIAKKVQKDAGKNEYEVKVITSHIRGADRPQPDEIGQPGQLIIATQTVEAGVDFTLDVLITELTVMPSLWQRLGRLNRDGSSAIAQAYMLIPEEKGAYGSSASQAIYQTAPLQLVAEGLLSLENPIDASVAQQKDIEMSILQACNAQPGDFWGKQPVPARFGRNVISKMLGLTNTPLYETDGFLHGIQQEDEQHRVTVLWRDVSFAENTQKGLQASITTLRPLPAETIEISITKASKLVEKKHTQDYIIIDNSGRLCSRIIPGCTIVMSTHAGGLTDRGIVPNDNIVVSDVSMKIVLSEDLGLKNQFVPITETAVYDLTGKRVDVADYYEQLSYDEMSPAAIRKQLSQELSRAFGYPIEVKYTHDVFLMRRKPKEAQNDNHVVYLHDHLTQVGNTAADYAQIIQLDNHEASSLQHAGYFHDLGKMNALFQVMLGKLPSDEPLAKSTGRLSGARPEALHGYLHEVAGAQYVQDVYHDDLAQWLIVQHHGRARGITRNRYDIARYTPLRVRCEENYGVYGLLHLEAVLRCADWYASAYPKRNEFPVSEEVTQAISSYHDTYKNIPDTDVQYAQPLEGLSGANLVSWYAVVGILRAAQELGYEAYVKWVNAVPVVSLDDEKLTVVLHHIVDRLQEDYDYATQLVDKYNELAGGKPSGLKIQNHRPVIHASDIYDLYISLKGNVYQNLFSSWVQAASFTDKGLENFSFTIPFLAANSTLFEEHLTRSTSVSKIQEALKDQFVGWRNGESKEALNLSSEIPNVNPYVSLLGLYGGITDIALSQFSLGATKSNDRFLPLVDLFVNVDELTQITYGLAFYENIEGLSYLYGKNDKEKTQKILPGVLIQ